MSREHRRASDQRAHFQNQIRRQDEPAGAHDAALRRGVNVMAGKITHAGVAEAFGMAHTPVEEIVPST